MIEAAVSCQSIYKIDSGKHTSAIVAEQNNAIVCHRHNDQLQLVKHKVKVYTLSSLGIRHIYHSLGLDITHVQLRHGTSITGGEEGEPC